MYVYTLHAVAHVGSVIDLGLVGPAVDTHTHTPRRHAGLDDILHTSRPKQSVCVYRAHLMWQMCESCQFATFIVNKLTNGINEITAE